VVQQVRESHSDGRCISRSSVAGRKETAEPPFAIDRAGGHPATSVGMLHVRKRSNCTVSDFCARRKIRVVDGLEHFRSKLPFIEFYMRGQAPIWRTDRRQVKLSEINEGFASMRPARRAQRDHV